MELRSNWDFDDWFLSCRIFRKINCPFWALLYWEFFYSLIYCDNQRSSNTFLISQKLYKWWKGWNIYDNFSFREVHLFIVILYDIIYIRPYLCAWLSSSDLLKPFQHFYNFWEIKFSFWALLYWEFFKFYEVKFIH